ncbi:YajG family lipoprotein [Geobacter sp. SVR]|uniref:YajG family lipoprotein n=1 Tax=Geobacter sp. SVR TaxID=2495594 RepID=UPI00143EF500|nr:YajG family lipoprotein [Geobacter sp. SVR]BCS54503.1 hypothetical protein GSVR_28110 [Geobacter sp. SVR]GCF87103.1 lipoprotein [Geobacter sp. SVR]
MTFCRSSLHCILAGSVLAAGLAGCAAVDQKVGLGYAQVDRSFGRQSGDIAVSRVEAAPARNLKGEWVIGSLNNVHGVHQADLLTDRSLGEWISEALLLELKHAGYTVTYTSSLPADAPRGILITNINAFMNVNQGVVSADLRHELKFNIDLFLNGVKTKSFNVASRDNQTIPLTASKETKEKVMLQSLQDAIQQIMPEIVALTGTGK